MGMKPEQFDPKGTLPIHLGGGAACAALLLCGWLVGLNPLLSQNTQGAAVIDQAQQAEQQATAAKAELDRVTRRLDQVRSELEHQPMSLSSASQINPLLAQLAAWADEHRLTITRTRAGRPEALRYYDYVPIQLAGEGQYADLLSFFQQLHTARGDLSLTAFSVRRIQKQSGASVGFELDLAWYVVTDQAPQPKPADPAPATAGVQIRR